MPVVSIVVPVFNTGEVLRETLSSLTAQQPSPALPLPEYEIVVVDDRSTDPATLSILGEAASPGGRIRVLSNTHAKGAAGARNTGLQEARGSWIAFCDSDDMWTPDALAIRWATIVGNPGINWLATGYLLLHDGVGIDPKPFEQRFPCLYGYVADHHRTGTVARLPRAVTMMLKCGCPGVLTNMARRELLLDEGGFEEDMHRAEDYLLWLKLAAREDYYFLPVDTGIYRLRQGSLTRSGNPYYWGEDLMLAKMREDARFAGDVEAIKARLAVVLNSYCYYFRRHGNWAEARKWSSVFVRELPFTRDAWKQWTASMIRQ